MVSEGTVVTSLEFSAAARDTMTRDTGDADAIVAGLHSGARLSRREALAAVLGADARVAQTVLVAVQVRLRLRSELADRLAVRTANRS